MAKTEEGEAGELSDHYETEEALAKRIKKGDMASLCQPRIQRSHLAHQHQGEGHNWDWLFILESDY